MKKTKVSLATIYVEIIEHEKEIGIYNSSNFILELSTKNHLNDPIDRNIILPNKSILLRGEESEMPDLSKIYFRMIVEQNDSTK